MFSDIDDDEVFIKIEDMGENNIFKEMENGDKNKLLFVLV